jgi:site-specific DNA-methyltransferase (adenine-specific)
MYKLILGDSVEELQKMDDESVALVVTSCPYPGVPHMWGDLFAAERFDDAHAWLDKIWDECVRVLEPGCKLAINVANTGRRPYLDNCARIAMWGRWNQDKVEHLGNIVWDKSHGVTDTAWGSWLSPADISLTDDCEFILVFRKIGKRNVPQRGELIDKDDFLAWRHSIWKIKAESAKAIGHIAPFPLEIPRRCSAIPITH